MVVIEQYSLVLKSVKKTNYRILKCYDIKTKLRTDYYLFEKSGKLLWKQIEQFEKKEKPKLPELDAQIKKVMGLEVLILKGQSDTEAFERQKWKLNSVPSIGIKEIQEILPKTCGYVIEQEGKEIYFSNLVEIEKKAQKIKFRYYIKAKKGEHPGFNLTDWFLIKRE